MLTLIKLGGSLVTDKRQENAFRPEVAARVGAEIRDALDAQPDLKLIVGHGSGSFGHVAARRYGTIAGVHTPEQWRGFAEVANVAAELNMLMTRTLQTADVPVIRIQPSASALARDGVLESMALEPIRAALEHGLVPLVYGDVAHDYVRGGTIISTETVFFYLAEQLPVSRVFLLGDVDGVYDPQGIVIPRISPANLASIEAALGGSGGTDVTGGMETKVRDMVALVMRRPTMTIRIFSGMAPRLLTRALTGAEAPGTLIAAD